MEQRPHKTAGDGTTAGALARTLEIVRARLDAAVRDGKGRLRRMLWVPLPDARPAELDADTVTTMAAAVEALLDGTGADPASYVIHLRELARSRGGMAAALEASARHLRRRAKRRFGRDLADCTLLQRLEVLPLPPASGSAGAATVMRRLWHRATDRADLLAYVAVTTPVLRRYAATDAWLDVGYPQHPGQHRRRPTVITPAGEKHR